MTQPGGTSKTSNGVIYAATGFMAFLVLVLAALIIAGRDTTQLLQFVAQSVLPIGTTLWAVNRVGKVNAQVQDVAAELQTVKENTNGTLSTLVDTNQALHSHLHTLETSIPDLPVPPVTTTPEGGTI